MRKVKPALVRVLKNRASVIVRAGQRRPTPEARTAMFYQAVRIGSWQPAFKLCPGQ
jgi:hypothetical protein